MSVVFHPAQRTQAKLRMAIEGPAGSGKTMTALRISKGLDPKRPALIDTEAGSASLYADRWPFDGIVLKRYLPRDYVEAIASAEAAGYSTLIIDSLSHEWQATLAEVDARAANMKNKAAAWNGPSQDHEALVQRILQSSINIIATMRSKVDYDLSGGEVKKLGLAPVQRADVDYEFTIVGDLNLQHVMRITKTRFSGIADQSFREPGEDLGKQLAAWLSEGAPAPTAEALPATPLIPPTMDEVPADAVSPSIQRAIAAALEVASDHDKAKAAVAAEIKRLGYSGWSDFLARGSHEDAAAVVRLAQSFDRAKVGA
jgi:hypothetical protein